MPHPFSDQGFAHLREQNFGAARLAFEQVQAADALEADDAVGLALACARLNDAAAAQRALDAALRLQPGHLRAMLMKADLFAQTGESREAAIGYQLALQAHPDPSRLSAAQQRDWQRAQAMVAHYQELFANQLEQGLQQAMLNADARHGAGASQRFRHALALLRGERQVFRSQPRLFQFPELPDIEFFDPSAFPWVAALEAQTDAIREELLGLLGDRELPFRPYVERVPGRAVAREDSLLDNPDWSACYLWRDGAPVPEVQARCPRTVAALAQVPLVRMPGRAPNVLFSLLRPGTHIPPHHGFLNTRCIVHLPLIVPSGCALRVGNGVHAWQEGRVVVFDDSIEHEAWNRSDRLRVILLFEVWRPELSGAERELVHALFDALNLKADSA